MAPPKTTPHIGYEFWRCLFGFSKKDDFLIKFDNSVFNIICINHGSFVGWVEPTQGFVGFRCTQSNLHFAIVVAKLRNPTTVENGSVKSILRWIVKHSNKAKPVFNDVICSSCFFQCLQFRHS
jgi:hypothetical protein